MKKEKRCLFYPQLRKDDVGFTLIEMLIVIVILSVTLTFSILIFGDFGKTRQAKMTAEKTQHMLVYLRENAILESTDIRTLFTKVGYQSQFVTALLANQSQKLPRFTTGTFPNGIVVHFNNGSTMTIYFHPSGAITPFKMNFGTSAHPDIVVLQGYANGKIVLSESHDT